MQVGWHVMTRSYQINSEPQSQYWLYVLIVLITRLDSPDTAWMIFTQDNCPLWTNQMSEWLYYCLPESNWETTNNLLVTQTTLWMLEKTSITVPLPLLVLKIVHFWRLVKIDFFLTSINERMLNIMNLGWNYMRSGQIWCS